MSPARKGAQIATLDTLVREANERVTKAQTAADRCAERDGRRRDSADRFVQFRQSRLDQVTELRDGCMALVASSCVAWLLLKGEADPYTDREEALQELSDDLVGFEVLR